MSYKKNHVELYKGRSRGKQVWRWRYVLSDGDITAKSPEAYLETSINPCVRRLQKNLRIYTTEEFTSRNGQHHWKILSNNGKIVALSDKGYDTKKECRHFMNGFLVNFPHADWVKRFSNGKVKEIER